MKASDFPKLKMYDSIRMLGYSHEDTLELLAVDGNDHEVFQVAYLTARKDFVSTQLATPEEMANGFLDLYRSA